MKPLDLKGRKFGRWSVISRGKNNYLGRTFWFCLCDCGTLKQVMGNNLNRGITKSCGCLKLEKVSLPKSIETRRKIGLSKLGKKRPSWVIKKISGPRHYNFKGGKPKCSSCSIKIAHGAKLCWPCFKLNCAVKERKYSQEFNRKLKSKIIERDNNTCQLCGKIGPDIVGKKLTALSVNHIDFNKRNNTENNLNVLCRSCNTKINSKRLFFTEFFQQYQTCSP